jgi:hypothetical protein
VRCFQPLSHLSNRRTEVFALACKASPAPSHLSGKAGDHIAHPRHPQAKGRYNRGAKSAKGQAVTYLIFKALFSGLIVAAVSEIAKRSPAIGGLVASLPLVSVLAMIWLWRDTADTARIAEQSEATFWYVIPSLPLFLVLPALLRNGMSFWLALLLSCVMTIALYAVTVLIVARFGIKL